MDGDSLVTSETGRWDNIRVAVDGTVKQHNSPSSKVLSRHLHVQDWMAHIVTYASTHVMSKVVEVDKASLVGTSNCQTAHCWRMGKSFLGLPFANAFYALACVLSSLSQVEIMQVLHK
ncbi:unnamed protein product [Ostreobium quekettii]|uniref:Uncharacterized protein n=1 Tax=Ostreobium quekettii TaxID=121088 RepID=A0A8S1JCN9_9CHLO|nr:unnamed protein product [Ostreobium quekettii]